MYNTQLIRISKNKIIKMEYMRNDVMMNDVGIWHEGLTYTSLFKIKNNFIPKRAVK